MTKSDIDQKLLETYKKLRETDNVVIQHRLIKIIDQLLDKRNQLKK